MRAFGINLLPLTPVQFHGPVIIASVACPHLCVSKRRHRFRRKDRQQRIGILTGSQTVILPGLRIFAVDVAVEISVHLIPVFQVCRVQSLPVYFPVIAKGLVEKPDAHVKARTPQPVEKHKLTVAALFGKRQHLLDDSERRVELICIVCRIKPPVMCIQLLAGHAMRICYPQRVNHMLARG